MTNPTRKLATEHLGDRIDAYRVRMIGDRTAWQGLYYLNLYRIFVSALLLGLFMTPLLSGAIPDEAVAVGRSVAMVMALMSPALLLLGNRVRRRPGLQALAGIALDLWATLVVLRATGGLASGLGNLLIGDTLLAAVIFPLRLSLLYAAGATLAILYQSLISVLQDAAPASIMTPSGILGAAYFATTLLGFYLATRVRESQAIARQRGLELANLTQINDLIIQRMSSGIVLVDSRDQAHLLNDAAWYIAGMPESRSGPAAQLLPDLGQMLADWRRDGTQPSEARVFAHGTPPALPRFAGLSGAPSPETLCFLEDSRLTAQRAQELTLASLGRLSATIAHEIRNPLGAISHSAQLLGESNTLDQQDRRLVEIIQRHCLRVNDIVENVLNLARQAPPAPATISLGSWLDTFIAEYRRYHDTSGVTLSLARDNQAVAAVVKVDPTQLQQVLWNLVQNALKYGRDSAGGGTIIVDYGEDKSGTAWITVADEGSGIPAEHQDQIFEPFFRPRGEGTGLGLYLCKRLIEANGGNISYQSPPEGGSRFRLELPSAATTGLTLED